MVYNTWDNIFGSGQYKTAKFDSCEKSHSEVWTPISTAKVNETLKNSTFKTGHCGIPTLGPYKTRTEGPRAKPSIE